ncbi:MAG: YbgC/FadM family acyl-CoA thioesterase [Burkholderiales bacterium]
MYYQDTDAGGVVFHAQYFAFMERARTELLNAAGIDLARLAEDSGVQFMVANLQAKYHRGARLNEQLSVSAEVVKIGRASVVFRQRVERAGEVLVEAEITLAVVDKGRMKPARMPIELERALT